MKTNISATDALKEDRVDLVARRLADPFSSLPSLLFFPFPFFQLELPFRMGRRRRQDGHTAKAWRVARFLSLPLPSPSPFFFFPFSPCGTTFRQPGRERHVRSRRWSRRVRQVLPFSLSPPPFSSPLLPPFSFFQSKRTFERVMVFVKATATAKRGVCPLLFSLFPPLSLPRPHHARRRRP